MNGETKFVLNAPNGQYIGGATFSLVNAHAPGETVMTARGNRKALGGVPLADLRRTVIDKMIAAPAYVEDGKPKLRYQLYHEEKAKGGIGMTMFGGSSFVAPDTPSVFGQLDVSKDEIIPYFQEFSDRITDDSAQLIATFLANSRSLPVETSQR